MKPFRWSTKSEEAALLVAADELTNEAIAERVGISRQGLTLWKRHPDFMARVAEHIEATRAAILRRGVALRENRVQALHDRWLRLRKVIDERAVDEKNAAVPGGTTGLLAYSQKGLGGGDNFVLVDHWEVDTGLLKELREHEKQAAQELGQWVDRHEHDLRHLSDDELIAEIKATLGGGGEAGPQGRPG